MADEGIYSSVGSESHKRKYDDSPSPAGGVVKGFSSSRDAVGPPSSYKSVPPPLTEFELAKQKAQEIAARLLNSADPLKRARVDNGIASGGGFDSSDYGSQRSSGFSFSGPTQALSAGYSSPSKKIEVPNGRVGVIIGRGGETIKYLQLQSGAKIQVTRDMDADPNSTTRSVELVGTPDQIAKAEQLISDVLSEAEAGASGGGSRRLSGPPPGAEQFVMKIPNNKVGLVIGKGGETIKNMQASTGARIQVIPLHLPPGDMSRERTVQIDGTSEQIEASKQFIEEVTSEAEAPCEESQNCDNLMNLSCGMKFDSIEDAFKCYSRYAKQEGFSAMKSSSKNGTDGKVSYVTFACSRGRGPRPRATIGSLANPRPSTKIGCGARVNMVLDKDGRWRLSLFNDAHNHDISPSKAKYLRAHRVVDEHTKRRIELNDRAGITTNKSYSALQIEDGPSNVSFTQKDIRNHLDRVRRLKLVEGNAVAMNRYFMKMQRDNSDFFYALDLDDEGRLKNVFWADARSRAAAKEFGDVVTFDTTYLVNRYDMPFAPFVGVNHHGQSILLGCGLISHEDTESFSWLFQTWKTCMWNCAPNAIITDQCMAMKNAIADVFPRTRHRWCIWHIMKKIPEKLSGYREREKMSWCMRRLVYSSLTSEEFEIGWKIFIEEYELQDNTWLEGLYAERCRWVPVYLKDIFWAGMSSTQRSEGMNAYFDNYIHSKTTLKQFVEQYENLLANKVEKERLEDTKSWSTIIPLLRQHDELEKQFQSVYTNAKFREFQQEIMGKLDCEISKMIEGDICEYEVREMKAFGEDDEKMLKEVAFKVEFNVRTNESRCLCRLFEFKGIVCRHQLMVWFSRRIQKAPEKYVRKRWCKHVKRAHTKVRIGYDTSFRGKEVQFQENIINLSKEVANLVEDSSMRYEEVMSRLRELQQKYSEEPDVASTKSEKFVDDETQLKETEKILDPNCVRRKGRPKTNRMQGTVEKIIAKKRKKKQVETAATKQMDVVEDVFISQCSSTRMADEVSLNDVVMMEFDTWMQSKFDVCAEKMRSCQVQDKALQEKNNLLARKIKEREKDLAQFTVLEQHTQTHTASFGHQLSTSLNASEIYAAAEDNNRDNGTPLQDPRATMIPRWMLQQTDG